MCDDCTNQREQIKSDLIGMLSGEDNDLNQAVDRNLPDAVIGVHKRIDAAVERDGRERPSDDEVREAVRDCLVAAVLATGAAALARSTPGYTDEGGESPAMILGMWAGVILENEVDYAMQAVASNFIKQHLGMGDN